VRGAPKVKAKAKALAVGGARLGRGLRRPAAEEEGIRGDKEVSEVFDSGQEVAVDQLGLTSWKVGIRVIFTEAIYWEEKVKVAGMIKGLHMDEDQTLVRLKLEGTQAEALVKWSGAHPGKWLDVHLCPVDCSKLSKDGLLHGLRVRLLTPSYREAWMDNLVEVAAGRGAMEVDELRRLRERAEKRAAETTGEQRAPITPGVPGSSSSSESGKGRKKKKQEKAKKAKKKEARSKNKITGTKGLLAVFGTTALDPTPGIRRRVRRKAKRAARRRTKRGSSSQTSSEETSSGSQGSVEDPGHLFGEEVKVKMVSKRFPGALTLNALEMIQRALVSQSGQPWDIDRSSLPPLFSQHWRLNLTKRMSGPMNREAQTLCFLQDLLLQGKIATTCDTITQRLKSLEQIAQGSYYGVAQRQELVPQEVAVMSTPMETLEASRLEKEEAKAKSASARPWSRPHDWERRQEGEKGKGKQREGKGKGKSKGEKGGHVREDKDKEKK
jgi:hypothetical protein